MTQGEAFQIKSEKVKHVFGNELKHHCLRCGHDSNATPVIPVNSVPFLIVWSCRFSNEVIFSGHEELDSSGNDLFTSWAKLSEREILVEHVVDIENEAYERRDTTSSHLNSSRKRFATRSIVQSRLSIYNWNPGLCRAKEDAFEKQIAGMWHIITLQEASEYDHELVIAST